MTPSDTPEPHPTPRRDSCSLSLAQPMFMPTGSYLNRQEVDLLAEQWAAKVTDRGDPDWMTTFMLSLGGDVRPSEDRRGLLLVAERMDCFVTTGANIWALCEALGHLVLHLQHCDPADSPFGDQPMLLSVPREVAYSGPYARARMEAIWFAMTFLTPEASFRAAWGRNDGDIRRMRDELRLPVMMVSTRALHLGLRWAPNRPDDEYE